MASRSRGFFVSGGLDGAVRPAGNRGEVAAHLGRGACVLDGRSRPTGSAPAHVLRARDVPVDAMALPEVFRSRTRVPERGTGQVVPERPDRPGERAGDQRPVRTVWRGGRVEEPRAMVLPLHGVR